VQCHADDLRVEIGNDWSSLTDVAGPPPEVELDGFVHKTVDDWRGLPLRVAVRALFEHAEKLTLRPSECSEADIEALRGRGWQDKDIHDAVQVAAYFNYINRIADGLGVELEAEHPRWGGK
jgi:alkylhydroperoxidase family enzyme